MVTATSRRSTLRPVKASGSATQPAPTRSGPLTLEIVQVTPALAEEWMLLNVSNRQIRKGRIAEFKRDMLAHNWRAVGDPVRFDTNGEMCDGQHRMIALVAAGKVDPTLSFEWIIVRGVAPEDRHVIDTGTRRSAADQLRIAGHRNPTMLASAAKWCAMWDRNALYASDSSTRSVTHAEIMQYVIDHPDLETVAARVAGSYRRRIDIPPGYIAAVYYLCHRKNKKLADEFFDRVADGVGLMERDPILALRSRLRDLDKSRANLPGEMWMGLLVRTWNARREGRTLRTLPVYKNDTPIPCPDIK